METAGTRGESRYPFIDSISVLGCGTRAALAARTGTDLRELDLAAIRQLLTEHDAIVPTMFNNHSKQKG